MPETDLEKLMQRYKDNPFEIYPFLTGRCGVVYLRGEINFQSPSEKESFETHDGLEVQGPKGHFQDIPGTVLYSQLREGNLIPIHSPVNGEVVNLHQELHNAWVEAGTPVLSVKHQLTKEEVIDKILEKVLTIYYAPEPAKYRFTPELIQRIEREGPKQVVLRRGEEFLIKSKMKKEETLTYEGEEGIIYARYFDPGKGVKEDDLKLVGICFPEKVREIDRIILQISLGWDTE